MITVFNIDLLETTAYATVKEAAQTIMSTCNDASLEGNWIVNEIVDLRVSDVTNDCQVICESIAEEIAQAQDELEATESGLAGGANRY